MPIYHSKLAEFLYGARIDNNPLPPRMIDEIIAMTRHGVMPEGSGPTANLVMVEDSHSPAGDADGGSMPIMAARKPTGFRFGPASRKELVGVRQELVNVATLALEYYTTQDFCCYDGIRTLKEQQDYVRRGTSKTMKSKHLEGLAVDLVPWINGKPVWDWPGCFKIASAMQKAATELGVADRIVWGGAWDRRLSDFKDSTSLFEEAVAEYRQRHAGKDFIDGPHFEWHND